MLLCCMKTIKDVFNSYRQELCDVYEANEREAITMLTISEISGFSKAKIKAFPELLISDEHGEKLSSILEELKTGKPIQYILGKTEFYGLPFYVNPAVLIPRPETEELVEWVLESIKHQRNINLLDIGTGSGCIAISLKSNRPDIAVSAIDISAEALKTAASNAELNNVEIVLIEADILNPTPTLLSGLSSRVSVIVSNPPYVTPHDQTQMHANVTDFEPHTALFVTEDDPLLFYSAIADFAVKRLVQGGLLFFEINENFGPETAQLLLDRNFVNVEVKKDMSGKDRMIRAELT